MRIKVYLSDDGFGHLVRQEAIMKTMLALNPDLEFTVQTKEKISVAKQKFGKSVNYIERFNNIETKKLLTGYLDLDKTEAYFRNYIENSDRFIDIENEEFDYDAVISDTVPEAHKIAQINKVPSFTTFHFEWSWLCRELYPHLSKTYKRMEEYYNLATKIYMPPYVPKRTEMKFKENSLNVPFIINKFDDVEIQKTGKINVLIMDNGTSTLSELIIHNFTNFLSLTNYHFFLPKKFAKSEGSNITLLEGLKNIHSHIPKVDVIIARAGYNTITESLITKVPLLLVGEGNNPEVKHNIDCIIGDKFGGSMSVDDYKSNFIESFENFMEKDYPIVKKNLIENNFKSNGADIVAKDMFKEFNKWQK